MEKLKLTELEFAHRGLHHDTIIENTMDAFEEAIANHYPIELDVHLTKDHQIVVFHDDTLTRMCGIDKAIKDCTYEELKQYQLYQTNNVIPLFSDVLKLVNGQVLIDIELKYDRPVGELEQELVKQLDLYTGPFLVKSFHPLIVRWFYRNRPNYIRGLLVGISNKNKVINYLLEHVALYHFVKPNFIACQKELVTTKRIQQLRKKIPIFVWVIHGDIEQYQSYADSFIFER